MRNGNGGTSASAATVDVEETPVTSASCRCPICNGRGFELIDPVRPRNELALTERQSLPDAQPTRL